jgi:hypothetical protein
MSSEIEIPYPVLIPAEKQKRGREEYAKEKDIESNGLTIIE